jgi:replicative DNA helicase
MQVDVTTRMGALTPATPTGFPTLDRWLNGGLRTGALVALTGGPGTGKTALSLLLAYMSARARAAVVFTSVSLDETEIMARLAARALNREHPEVPVHYGSIWSGQAWQDDSTRGPVSSAVETVVKKVGAHLHLHAAQPFESTAELSDCAAHLWGRYERVVMFVDGVEAFRAAAGGDPARQQAANAGLDSRVSQVAYELRRISELGCAVVVTVERRHAELVIPAATLALEIRPLDSMQAVHSERGVSLGARPVELAVLKNRVGPTGMIPLRFLPAVSLFEERTP